MLTSIVCGGTENMSAAPYAIPDARWGARMGDKKLVDTMIKDGLWDAYNNYHMGTTAENICDIWGITREELDEFALQLPAEGCCRCEVRPLQGRDRACYREAEEEGVRLRHRRGSP